jgi:hypothetical protein
MRFLVKATLKSGEVIEVPFPDRETLDAELRCIERWRKARWGLPALAWTTTTGAKWVLSVYDFAGPLAITEVAPAAAVVG